MKLENCPLEGLKLITLDVYRDERGFFMEKFNRDKLAEAGLPNEFVQDNHSRSNPGVIRGLHAQRNPDQSKLVGVMHGRILDVAVDIRQNSPSFGQYYSVELSAENGRLLWIPAGFLHGFAVIGDEQADVFYKVSAVYNPKGEFGVRYDDKDLNIYWGIKKPILSKKDLSLPSFKEIYQQVTAYN